MSSIRLRVTDKYILTVHAASTYDGVIRDLIMKKFSEDWAAPHRLGKLVASRISPQSLDTIRHGAGSGVPDVLVPVPLHWRRFAHRGFNQAEIIARELCAAWGNISVSTCVRRVRATRFQAHLGGDARLRNVQSAFALTGSTHDLSLLIRNKHVVIVDDLCTTGATLVNVARALTVLGPRSISAVVAARGR